jgi:hypothetical protein
VNVRVDHAGHQELTTAVDHPRGGWRLHARSNRCNAIAFDNHRGAGHRSSAGAVDERHISNGDCAATLGNRDGRRRDNERG